MVGADGELDLEGAEEVGIKLFEDFDSVEFRDTVTIQGKYLT